MSLLPSKPFIVSEIWVILYPIPYQVPYYLYSMWCDGTLNKSSFQAHTAGVGRVHKRTPPPPLIESYIGTIIRYQQLLMMIIKENIWYMGHRLVNHPHNNPFIVFTPILNWIEIYGNHILMMVDTFCYVTLLRMDVIGLRVSWSRYLPQIIGRTSLPIRY